MACSLCFLCDLGLGLSVLSLRSRFVCIYTHSSEMSVVLSDSETEDELLLPEFITKRTLWECESTEFVPIKNRK
jgi:hypothetical protein